MLQPRILTLAIAAATLGLSACNSNDHDSPSSAKSTSAAAATTTITVTPSLGKIVNARVILRNARTGVELAPAKTLTPADNGVATFTVPVAKLAEPVLAAVLPTTAGKIEYADEAVPDQTTTITVPPADINKPVLRVAASVLPNANLGLTALTEAAVQQAEKAAGGLTRQNINLANAEVKNQLKLNFDITQAPVVVGLGEFGKLVDQALDAQRRAYAAYLATLAKEAKRINPASASPALDIAKAFADDFAHDGAFNAVGSSQLALAYNAQFINAWLNWVSNFYSALLKFNNADVFNHWFDNFNAVTPPVVPVRVVEGIVEYRCEDAAKLRSATGPALDIDFVNQTGNPINIDWITGSGSLSRYSSNLPTGQTYTIHPTFVTHPWKITNSSGQCLGVYAATTASKKTLTFKPAETVLAGEPINTGGNPDTCASKGLPIAQLSSLTAFVGNYEVTLANSTASLFSIEASGKATLNNQVARFKELCGPNVQSNGTNFVLITHSGNVTLFKDNANVISAEGEDFTTPATDVFFGTKKTVVDPLKPIRTINGVEEYRCDSWGKIGNGVADGTPVISFVNQLGANTSLSLFGLSSINRTTTLFTGILNGATRQQTALKNQFVRIDNAAGQCLGVFKSFTNVDKTITVKPGVIEVSDTPVVNSCTTQGADNKIGFASAPADFCGFTKASETVIPDMYTFFNADKSENIKVVVNGNVVTGVAVENGKYGFACGTGIDVHCSGISIKPVGTTGGKEFIFNNAEVKAVSGTTQNMTLKSGSLIYAGATGGGSGLTLPNGTVVTGAASVKVELNPFIANSRIITFTQGNAGVTIYDYVDTIGIAAGDSGLSIGITPANACAINPAVANANAPLCSSVGVNFDHASGVISFSNTPMHPIVFSCPGDCKLNGSLSFPNY